MCFHEMKDEDVQSSLKSVLLPKSNMDLKKPRCFSGTGSARQICTLDRSSLRQHELRIGILVRGRGRDGAKGDVILQRKNTTYESAAG